MKEMQDTGPSAADKEEWAKSDITFSMELLFLKRQTKEYIVAIMFMVSQFLLFSFPRKAEQKKKQ